MKTLLLPCALRIAIAGLGLLVLGAARESGRTDDPALIVPLAEIAPEARESVAEIIRENTFHERGAPETFPCNSRIYLNLLNEPALTLALWKDLSASPVRLQQVGPNQYQGTDGNGAAASWEFVYRAPKLHVLLCKLQYNSPHGAAHLEGRIVLVVHSGYYREVNGEQWVQHDVEAFVKIDSKGWKLVAKTLRPVLEKLLEDQVREAGWFVSLMGRLVAMYPNWACQVTLKQTDLDAELKQRFRDVVIQTRRPGAFTGRPALADNSPETNPLPPVPLRPKFANVRKGSSRGSKASRSWLHFMVGRLNLRQVADLPLEGTDESLIGSGGTERLACATWAFVGFGVALRLVTYALDYPLWGDEAFVAVNFIKRGYGDLLRPLDYDQICPLLFLWLELTAVKLFGFSELSLRLFPTCCSVASVFLFADVAGRVARGPARLLAVAAFAVAFYPIRHGAEVKPYSSDLLAALILLALALEWWRAPARNRWLWALAAAVPLALGLSHPTVFLAGGISLALLGMVWKRRRQGALLPFVLYNLAMVGTFFALFAVFTGAQEQALLHKLRSHYWAEAFPPLTAPAKLLVWLAVTHTGRMFAYPFGGPYGASIFTTFCFAVGLLVLWRRRETALLLLTLAPFGLTFIAAVLGHYPYGGSARTMMFTAPLICLLSAQGQAALIARLPDLRWRRGVIKLGVLVLAGAGVVVLGLKLAHPHKSVGDRNAREFARWFWTEQGRDSELACVRSDLGLGFNRGNWMLFRSSIYLCNQKIYSPRHRLGTAVSWDAVSAARPLRCVLYNECPENDPACAAWVEDMARYYEVTNRATFIINPSLHRDDGTDAEDRYTVFDFVPRSAAPPRSDVPRRAS